MNSISIPDGWSGEDALIVVAFLEEVVHAIWNRHHREMGLVMERPYTADNPDTQIARSEEEDPDFGDDVLPF